MDDSDPLQPLRPVAERRAHASDLAIQPLSEDDAKCFPVDARYLAGLGHLAHDFDAARQHAERQIGDGAIDRDDVFLFVIILRPQDLIHDVAVIGEQNQAFGVLVESADGKNPLAMIDELEDVALDVRFGRRGNADWLIEGNIDPFFLGPHKRAIDAHFIPIGHLCTENGAAAVARDPSGFDPFVGFAPRTDTRFADELIEPHASRRLWSREKR